MKNILKKCWKSATLSECYGRTCIVSEVFLAILVHILLLTDS